MSTGIGSYSRAKLIKIIDGRHDSIVHPDGSDTQIQFNNAGEFGGISAFTWDDTNLKIADDTKLYFGTDDDTYIEYNEDGDDYLTISGSVTGLALSGSVIDVATNMVIKDDIKLYFGTNKDASIEYDEDSTDSLVINLPLGGGDINLPALGTEALQIKESTNAYMTFNVTNEAVVFDKSPAVSDNVKLAFGHTAGTDSYIEYNEDGDNFLVISGSSAGIVLSGSTVEIAGTLVGASPLKIGGGIQIVSVAGQPATAMSFGDDIKLHFGDDDDTHIQFKNSTGQYIEISGSNNGIVLSGSSVYVDQKLGIGIFGDDITHAITLPNNANTSGQIKANAYITYSSARLKENITQINNPIDILNNIQGVTFDWKENKKKDFGFIAEDIGKHLPHIVTWEDNNLDAQGLDYNKIIPILVEAIKFQQDKIDTLRHDLNKLKNLFPDSA